jgi:hypothetical protein
MAEVEAGRGVVSASPGAVLMHHRTIAPKFRADKHHCTTHTVAVMVRL